MQFQSIFLKVDFFNVAHCLLPAGTHQTCELTKLFFGGSSAVLFSIISVQKHALQATPFVSSDTSEGACQVTASLKFRL